MGERESGGQPGAGAGSSAASAAAGSVGLYLASQRRLRGISLDELAARTRIPRRNLERLESGVFDASPDGFARGFVRTVAQALGLDPDEAVMRLMREPAAEDAERARRARVRTVWLRVGIVAVGLVAALGAWKLVASLLPIGGGAPMEREQPALVYRRDAVGELAGADGSLAEVPKPPEPEAAPETEP